MPRYCTALYAAQYAIYAENFDIIEIFPSILPVGSTIMSAEKLPALSARDEIPFYLPASRKRLLLDILSQKASRRRNGLEMIIIL